MLYGKYFPGGTTLIIAFVIIDASNPCLSKIVLLLRMAFPKAHYSYIKYVTVIKEQSFSWKHSLYAREGVNLQR